MPTMNVLHQPYWSTMGPLIVVVITAFLVMILEFLFQKGDRRWLPGVSFVGVAVALVVALLQYGHTQTLALHGQAAPTVLNTVVADAFGNIFSVLLLISALLILLFTMDYAGKHKVAAEHTYLILFAIAGGLAMATAIDLVTLYVGLELLSVSSYVLVALRKRAVKSVEGAVKYLIMGSIGSAVLLYGMSFIYGIAGTTNLDALGQAGPTLWAHYPAVVLLSFLLMLAGMGVKLSFVPFHMWTPDTYEGAPAPISAFLATLSKTAAFAMLVRMLLYIFNAAGPHIYFWAAILAAVTMIVGNLIALPQRNMKRLLAFSSVAQAGYVLVPFALFGTVDPASTSGATIQLADWASLFSTITFYLFAYTFMTIGAFAIVHLVSYARQSHDDEALVGLYRRSPWLAIALTVFILSLAGAPLTAGFIGKFYIFTDTLHLGYAWLGIVLFGTSVISFFYYIGWLKKVFRSDLGDAPDWKIRRQLLREAGYVTTGGRVRGDAADGAGASGTAGGAGSAGAPATTAAATAAVAAPAAHVAPDIAPIKVSPVMHVLLAVCVAGTLVLGLVPSSLLHVLLSAQWF